MDVRLPRLGEGADSGAIVNIFVKEGDPVKTDQTLLELENEKAVASIPSPATGTVTKVHVKVGDKISVGQLIVSLAESAGVVASAPAGDAPQRVQGGEPKAERKEAMPVVKSAFGPAASPTLRRMARDLGIDLNRVQGSERGGRIVLADLRAYIQRLQESAVQPAAAPAQPPRPAAPSIDFSKWGPVRREKPSLLRTTIARRMTESWTTIPHVTQFDEADISRVLDQRKKYLAAYEQKGAHLTVTSFILKAVVAMLQKYPIFNSSYDESAEEIVFKQYIHVGIAVDTEHGLIVPVLRDTDKKSMLDLTTEMGQLAEKARQRKVTGDDLKGGTFTISNQGGIGGGQFTPIINKPEAAILGVGRGALKAVVKAKQMEPRTMLPLALSYDHRLIDGAHAARFIVDLVQALESFNEADVKTE